MLEGYRNFREWYMICGNQHAGPYSIEELKKDCRFTPDTLVWKKGFQEWVKARFVPELQEVFKDSPTPRPLHETDKDSSVDGEHGQEGQATLTLQQEPDLFFLWVLLAALIIFYSMYHFYYRF